MSVPGQPVPGEGIPGGGRAAAAGAQLRQLDVRRSPLLAGTIGSRIVALGEQVRRQRTPPAGTGPAPQTSPRSSAGTVATASRWRQPRRTSRGPGSRQGFPCTPISSGDIPRVPV